MLSKRILARLDIKGSRLIKGIRFEGLRVLGESLDSANCYYKSNVDEIIYLDSVASLYGRNNLSMLLKKASESVFVPITAGGGVRNLDDAKELLSAGADKIAINTACIKRPNLITELAEALGKQCVVVSIQARKRHNEMSWECMTEAGRERSNISVLDWVTKVQELGAGEILLTSVDQDGTLGGPDYQLINAVTKLSKVPLIVGGGIAKESEAIEILKSNEVSGISIGSGLHYKKLSISEIKEKLHKENINIRNQTISTSIEKNTPLSGIRVGIIDYGMGNQQSLTNALVELGAIVDLTCSLEVLDKSDIIALPGVGSFPEAMKRLSQNKMDAYIQNSVKKGKALLGICLGMQILFDSGKEFQFTKGLGLINGEVEKMTFGDNQSGKYVLPHVGWNKLIPSNTENNIFDENIVQYFVHSFAAINVPEDFVTYKCEYGNYKFVAAVNKSKVSGFQFHPELSGPRGLKLLSDEILKLVN